MNLQYYFKRQNCVWVKGALIFLFSYFPYVKVQFMTFFESKQKTYPNGFLSGDNWLTEGKTTFITRNKSTVIVCYVIFLVLCRKIHLRHLQYKELQLKIKKGITKTFGIKISNFCKKFKQQHCILNFNEETRLQWKNKEDKELIHIHTQRSFTQPTWRYVLLYFKEQSCNDAINYFAFICFLSNLKKEK